MGEVGEGEGAVFCPSSSANGTTRAVAPVRLLEDAFAEDEVIFPPRPIEAVQPNRAAAVWRVHETLLADIDADVADRTAGGKKNEVT